MRLFALRLTYLACLWLILPQSVAQVVVKPAIADQLMPARSAQLTGFVGEKLDAAYQNRILAQDADRLVAPFRDRSETRCWQSEFWGKWFTSAVLAYRYHPTPALKAKLDKAVAGLIATQTPDGYIGNYTQANHLQQWDIWGRKYCMMGLLAYYDLTQHKPSLLAARKLADHLMGELTAQKALLVKQGNHRGMAASSVLEPICQLYARTADQRYLAFAQEIVRQWETPDGPQLIAKADVPVARRFPKPANWFGPEQGQKAYEMMSCYEGLLELYRLTGNSAYRAALEKTWQNIRDTEINLAGSGSSVECWFGGKALQTLPISHYQETCVTATWIKLSQQLLRLTGEPKYADAIEQTYYNALLGSMKTDGSDWAKYTPLAGQRLEGGEQCGMGLNCCVASGPRGLFTLPLSVLMSRSDGVQVNFYTAGQYQATTPTGQLLRVQQQTDYPVSATIALHVILPKAEAFTIRVRVPAWSSQSTVAVNGQAVPAAVAGQYLAIQRTWQSGDQITVSLDMRGRVVQLGEQPAYLALVRGPIVLTRDARLGGPPVDESIRPVLAKDGYVSLTPVAGSQGPFWMQFEAPFLLESHKEGGNAPVPIRFCDYASAGNTLNEASRFRVWLPQPLDPSVN